MTTAGARADPWLLRLDARGVGPATVGLGVAAVLALVFVLQEWLLGRLSREVLAATPELLAEDVRLVFTHIAVVAYLVAAEQHALRSCARTVALLRPQVASPMEEHDWQARRTALRVASAVGLGVTFGVTHVFSPGPVSYHPATLTPETAWHRVLGLAIGVGLFRLGTGVVLDSLRLARMGAAVARVDLLDLSPLAPVARQGVTNVLLVAGFFAVYALFLVDSGYLGVFALAITPMLAAATAGLLLPMTGVRERIRTEKRSELDFVHERIRAARRRWTAGGDAAAEAAAHPPVSELLAWEERVAGVREWPLDARALRRLVLYLLIPLGSWSGGALVERAIDTLLD